MIDFLMGFASGVLFAVGAFGLVCAVLTAIYREAVGEALWR